MIRAAVASLLLLFADLSVYAQTFGEITGEVRDTSGAVVAAAVVTVTNRATNAARTTSTNDVGIYNFPALQPGTYGIKVEKSGFRALVQSGVELQVQQTARLDFTLQVGQIAETLEVNAATPLLNTENAGAKSPWFYGDAPARSLSMNGYSGIAHWWDISRN